MLMILNLYVSSSTPAISPLKVKKKKTQQDYTIGTDILVLGSVVPFDLDNVFYIFLMKRI